MIPYKNTVFDYCVQYRSTQANSYTVGVEIAELAKEIVSLAYVFS